MMVCGRSFFMMDGGWLVVIDGWGYSMVNGGYEVFDGELWL